MPYGIGDEVVLNVEEDFGYSDKTHRRCSVTILAYDADDSGSAVQYLCYIPQYDRMPKMFSIGRQHVSWYGLDTKYLGEQGCFISDSTPIFRHHPTALGENCDRCDEFIESAERVVDEKFFCRACRENPYR